MSLPSWRLWPLATNHPTVIEIWRMSEALRPDGDRLELEPATEPSGLDTSRECARCGSALPDSQVSRLCSSCEGPGSSAGGSRS